MVMNRIRASFLFVLLAAAPCGFGRADPDLTNNSPSLPITPAAFTQAAKRLAGR